MIFGLAFDNGNEQRTKYRNGHSWLPRGTTFDEKERCVVTEEGALYSALNL
jgi:hypothetical protein